MVRAESRFDVLSLACGFLSLVGGGVTAYGLWRGDPTTTVAGSALVSGAAVALAIGAARNGED